MGINESTVKHLNYFYNRMILVLLYDVKVNSGLVYLIMYMHFDIHSCGTSLSSLAQELRDLVNELPFKAA